MKHVRLHALAGLASAALLATTANAVSYTSDPLNGAFSGGGPYQSTALTGFGQYFTSTGGVLSSLAFLDSDSTNSGTKLIVQAFNTATMTAAGPVLFDGSGAVSGYGDHTFADGNGGYVDNNYYHTFSNIGVSLTAGQAYVAYLVNAPGSDAFNGTTTYGYTYDDNGNLVTDPPNQCSQFGCDDSNTPVGTEGNGNYSFGLGKYDSAITVAGLGAGVYRSADGTFTKVLNSTPGQSVYFQADYTIDIEPAAPGAVPEPASWAMMVGGFGLVGTAMRRSRRTSVSFS